MSLVPCDLIPEIVARSLPRSLTSLRDIGVINEDITQREMYKMCSIKWNGLRVITKRDDSCCYYLFYMFMQSSATNNPEIFVDAVNVTLKKSVDIALATIQAIVDVCCCSCDPMWIGRVPRMFSLLMQSEHSALFLPEVSKMFSSDLIRLALVNGGSNFRELIKTTFRAHPADVSILTHKFVVNFLDVSLKAASKLDNSFLIREIVTRRSRINAQTTHRMMKWLQAKNRTKPSDNIVVSEMLKGTFVGVADRRDIRFIADVVTFLGDVSALESNTLMSDAHKNDILMSVK